MRRATPLLMFALLCAACSKSGSAKVDTLTASPIDDTSRSIDSATTVTTTPAPVAGKQAVRTPAAAVKQPAPSKRRPDTILGRDSVIRLPRRTLPLPKPATSP